MSDPFDKVVEAYAIYLYAEEGFQVALYDDADVSWFNDRDDVRERYREKARRQLQSVGLP